MSIFELCFDRTSLLNKADYDDESLSEAIETIYPYQEKGEVVMNWNGYKIYLSLKYDISDMYRDIVAMTAALYKLDKGTFQINWPSSSFFAKWTFAVDDDTVSIDAQWVAVTGGEESIAGLLKVAPRVSVGKVYFLTCWNSLLAKLHGDLVKAGYDLENLSGYVAIQS